jgi:hypothetical protein
MKQFRTSAIMVGLQLALESAACAQTTAAPDVDTNWLSVAGSACNNESFTSFFQAFVRSQAVRSQYTADTVIRVEDRRKNSISRANYTAFPVALSDYTYVAPGAQPRSGTPGYLRLRFTDGEASAKHVHWVRVRYEGNGNDRDGQARVVGTIGKPGRLTFEKAGACWRLVEDARGAGVEPKP